MIAPDRQDDALPTPDESRRSDEELAAAAAAGDEAAFDQLYRRYRAPVWEVVRSFLGGAGPVDDVTQEVFVELYRSLGRFAGTSRFRTWAFALARNVARARRRRRWRWRRLVEPVAGEVLESMPEMAPGLVERLARGELRRRVRDEVERLPAASREILLLRDWGDLRYAEIARVLEIPVGTVRSRLHQARARLAEGLRGSQKDEGDDP